MGVLRRSRGRHRQGSLTLIRIVADAAREQLDVRLAMIKGARAADTAASSSAAPRNVCATCGDAAPSAGIASAGIASG